MTKLKLRYCSLEFPDFDIHLRTLKNKQQFSDDDKACEKVGINSTLWPIFGVVWESSEIMAQLMCNQDIKDKKILEIGCGIALSSLVLNERDADITATDYHPEAEKFLKQNVLLNNTKKIDFYLCDWKDKNTKLGRFDLVIGSDLLYQDDHPKLLSGFIDRHTNEDAEVILVSPKRGHQGEFDLEMKNLSFSHEKIDPEQNNFKNHLFNGYVHRYQKLA